MPIEIINQKFKSEPISNERIIDTIETNRDRIREVSNMLISTSGILIPVALAFIVFLVEKGVTDLLAVITLMFSILFFLITVSMSIMSSFLRRKYFMTNEAQFIEDLLSLLKSELRLLRYSFAGLIAGILAMIAGVVISLVSLI